MTNVKAQQFWVSGPPPGIRESLLGSGLVKDSDIPPVTLELPKTGAKMIKGSTLARLSGIDKGERKHPHSSLTSLTSRPVMNPLQIPHPNVHNHPSTKSCRFAQQSSMLSTRKPIPHNPSTSSNGPFPFPTENLLSSSRPQSEIEKALIDPAKVPNSRKESQKLLRKFHELTENAEIEMRNSISPEEKSEAFQRLLASYFLLWNDVIKQIKSYNQDYSLMLIQIKSFYQKVLKQLPELSTQYESELSKLQTEYDNLFSAHQKLEEDMSTLKEKDELDTDKIMKLKNELGMMKKQLEGELQAKSDIAMQNEDFKSKMTESLYRLGKIQEIKKNLEAKIEEDEKEIADCHVQNKNLENLIKQYEEEGAGFRPLYTKAAEELNSVKEQFEIIQNELNLYKKRDNSKVEIGTDPIFTYDQIIKTSTSGTSNKKKIRGTPSTFIGQKNLSLNPSTTNETIHLSNKQTKEQNSTTNESMHLANKQTKEQNPSISTFKKGNTSQTSLVNKNDQKSNTSLVTDEENPTKEKRIPIKEKTTSQLPIKETKSAETIIPQSNSSIRFKLKPSLTQKPNDTPILLTEMPTSSLEHLKLEEIIGIQNNSKDSEEKQPESNQQKSSQQKQDDEQQTQEIVIEIQDDFNVSNALPDDYIQTVSELMEYKSMVSYVYKLLPFPYQYYMPENDDFIQLYSIPKDVQLRDFPWTLRTVLTIMRDGFNTISSFTNDVSFKTIIQNVLKNICRNEIIVDKIEASLMTSVIHFRKVSKTLEFFLKFVTSEYSITDFRLFNILFSMALPVLYPKVESITNDPDINDDSQSFTIHTSNVNKLSEIFLHIHEFPHDTLEKLIKTAPDQKYPRLVSFWDFAVEFTNIFNDMHKNFHISIRNCLALVGAMEINKVMKEHFFGFIRILFPCIQEKDIKELWRKVSISVGETDAELVEHFVFLDWIGDSQSIVESIINLPRNDKFEQTFKQMSLKNERLFNFIRRRYITFIPRLLQRLPLDITEKIAPYITKIRNSLLRCDLCGCCMFYRHILQTVDLLITQSNPFIVFSQALQNDEMDHMIEFLKLREKTASLSIGFEIIHDGDDEIAEKEKSQSEQNEQKSEIV